MVVVVFCYMGETNMEYESTFPEIRPVAGGDAEDISFLCREGLGYHCDRILVENRIAQLDTPYELYHHPADPFVKRFIVDHLNMKVKSIEHCIKEVHP